MQNIKEPNVVLREDKTAEDYIYMYRKAMDFDTQRFTDYEENMAFYEGKQNFLSSYTGEKPWVVDINTVYASDAIDIRVASLLANDYKGEIEPLSAMDTMTVNNLNAAYSSFWDEMNMDKVVTDVITTAAVVREAYTHIIFENENVGSANRQRKGKLVAYPLDTSSVLIDPNAFTLKDADYVIIRGRITPQNVMDHYPDYDFDMRGRSSQFTPYERGEITIEGGFTNEQEDILTQLTIYEVKNRGKNNQSVYKTVLVENQIVEPTKKMKISKLPIAQFRWLKKHSSPYGISLMDRLLAQQKAVNAAESAIINTALQFAAPSLVVNVDSGLDPNDVALSAGMPAAVYPVSGVQIDNAIRPLFSGKSVDQTMLQIKDRTVETIYQMAGITQEFKGALGTAGNTSGGANMVVQRAKIIEQKVLANIEEYIEDLSHILIDFVTKVFEGEMIYTRSQKKTDGSFDFNQTEIPKVDNKNFNYTFAINLDVKTPYSKDQNKQLMLELFQMERQYNQGEPIITNVLDVMKQYNVPERNELMDRYKDMMTKDNQSKAQVITELVAAGEQYGIDPGMIQQAVMEIISNQQETPAVDQVFAMIEQVIAQREQAEIQQARQNPMPTGEEELQVGQGQEQQLTGDEVFNLA
jgi:hypothetical protein